MSEKIECLRYKTRGWIEGPIEIELLDGMLGWQGAHEGDLWFVQQPIEDCLREFVALDEGSPEAVLAFVRRRGVLGLMPLVTEKLDASSEVCSPAVDDFPDRYHYQEPVLLYTRLAHKFASIQRIIQSLNEGRAVKEADYYGCFAPEMAQILMTHKYSAATAHIALTSEVSGLWKTATTKLGIYQLLQSVTGLSAASPLIFELDFGSWADGMIWDFEAAKRTMPGSMLTPSASDYRSAYGYSDFTVSGMEGVEEALLSSGYRKSGEGTWLKPYRQEVEDFYEMGLPSHRDSMLLNVLVYQLMKAILLPVNTYFCSQCNKRYEYNSQKSKRPVDTRKAKYATNTWGNSKPREGRPTCFCSQECRLEYGKTDDGQRYSASASRKMKKVDAAGQ